MERLKEFQFDNRKMSNEVRKNAFKHQKPFAKQVMKNHKSSHSVEVCLVDSFAEAYEAAPEVMNVLLSGMYLENQKRFNSHEMQYKLSMGVSKRENGYMLVAQYR